MNKWPQKTTSMGRCVRCRPKRGERICEPALHRMKLTNAGGQRARRGCARARQDDHLANSDHMPRARIRNRGCIARSRHARRMHRSPAQELATPIRPSRFRYSRRHLKAQRLAHGHLSTASAGTRRHCWMRLSRCSQVWMGVAKPVLGRSITLRGSGTRGLFREHTLGSAIHSSR